MDYLLQFGATRALAEAVAETGEQVADLGLGEVAEGLSELAAAEAIAAMSGDLAEEGRGWQPRAWWSWQRPRAASR